MPATNCGPPPRADVPVGKGLEGLFRGHMYSQRDGGTIYSGIAEVVPRLLHAKANFKGHMITTHVEDLLDASDHLV
jgi:hypothetical protein